MLRKTIAFMIFLTGFFPVKGSCQQNGQDIVQVFVLRHAEKEANSPDPDLAPAGRQRAQLLASLLKDIPVARLYATPYKRTQQTLAPLAASKQLPVETYDPGDLKTLAAGIIAAKGQTIVVAGHANTAPALVNLLLGADSYPTLPEDDFGNLWQLILKDGKVLSCQLLNTNYH